MNGFEANYNHTRLVLKKKSTVIVHLDRVFALISEFAGSDPLHIYVDNIAKTIAKCNDIKGIIIHYTCCDLFLNYS